MLVQLSPREIEVLQLASRGLSNKEIGAQLGVVEGTVKIHVANIFGKLDVSDRTEAVIEAIKRGLVHIE
jgi:DNA-binding NarL/FixJ family response regulator